MTVLEGDEEQLAKKEIARDVQRVTVMCYTNFVLSRQCFTISVIQAPTLHLGVSPNKTGDRGESTFMSHSGYVAEEH